MYAYSLCYYTVAAQEGHNIMIAYPGENVELSCSLAETTGNTQNIRWLVGGEGPYGANSLFSGILTGYSANLDTTSIIIQNITMNDSRNGTEYQCVTASNLNVIQKEGDTVQLYVAGEYQHILR